MSFAADFAADWGVGVGMGVALLAATGWAVLGALLGVAHFGTLRLNTRLWLGQSGQSGASAQAAKPLAALGLQLLRLGTTGLGLALAARWGAAPGLVAAVLGLSVARWWLLRRVKRALVEQAP